MNSNFNRLVIFIVTTLIPPTAWALNDGTVVQNEIERIHRLEEILSINGIEGLAKATSREVISAPFMNSKYYTARITRQDQGLTVSETEKNNFGLLVAKELDRYSEILQQKTTSEERFNQCSSLLDLSDWFKSARGHGNYILTMRCENLSTVPLAYLIYDLDFPMDTIGKLRNRIISKVEEREFRRTILNHDAFKPFINELKGSEEEQENQMQYAWSVQWHAMMEWAKARGKLGSQIQRSDLPEELAFFLNEQPNSQQCTSAIWNFDRHASFVYGLREVGLENLKSFARYRELVGTWPTQPPNWWKPGDRYTKCEAAFEHAWLRFEFENGPLYSIAALVYEQLREGKYIDHETQLIRSASNVKND